MNDMISIKLTAEQIEQDCPDRLRQIANEIKVRLSKADKQTVQAKNHLIAVDRLLAEAKALCDSGGFDKFRELFCPQLGKSQAYALLAIAAGKKTLEDHRTEERERKRRTRANRKGAADVSGTVPELPSDGEQQEDHSGASDKTTAPKVAEPSKTRGPINPSDGAVSTFTTVVMELVRITKKRHATHFAKTAVPVDELARLGKLLSDIADLKSDIPSRPLAAGNDICPDQSAEAMKAKHAANDDEQAAA